MKVLQDQRDVEQIMFQEGQKLPCGWCLQHAPGHCSNVGRFKFRTSYGQNMISHTLEETRIGIKIASDRR